MDFLSDLWSTAVARNELVTNLWINHPFAMGTVVLLIGCAYYFVWKLT